MKTTKTWAVSNIELASNLNKKSFNGFNFLTAERITTFSKSNNLFVFYEGHVLLRYGYYSKRKGLKLIHELYTIYKNDFIKKVKGNFTIIIIDNNKFYIFSDRFGIKKYFYWVLV